MQLRVGALSSTTSNVVGEADSNAVYSQGQLLFLRENSLMTQPFDLKSLLTTGEAVPVAEHVERYLSLVQVGAFSASSTGLLDISHWCRCGGAATDLVRPYGEARGDNRRTASLLRYPVFARRENLGRISPGRRRELRFMDV